MCKVTAKSIKTFSRKVDIRKQVPQKQQQQSGVSYRAATKVAAKKHDPDTTYLHLYIEYNIYLVVKFKKRTLFKV